MERSDITTSIDTGIAAEGVPVNLNMNVIDMAGGNTAFVGAAVYVGNCDAAGQYSMYSYGVEAETYLRGVQVVGTDGTVTFTSIFPSCYSGRWPHIHFEVFPDVDSITNATNAVLTCQIALACSSLNHPPQEPGRFRAPPHSPTRSRAANAIRIGGSRLG